MTSELVLNREKPYPLGCYIDYDRTLVVRTVFGNNTSCGITLYPKDDADKPLRIEIPSSFKRGDIYSVRIKGIDDIASYESYNYFSDEDVFCDPYAKQFFGLEKFGKDVPDDQISLTTRQTARLPETGSTGRRIHTNLSLMRIVLFTFFMSEDLQRAPQVM